MKLSEICIQRPVFSWVLTLILILLGLVGGSRMSIEQYPRIERNFLTIEATLNGAGPEVVETQVTRVLEDGLAGMEGIVAMQSTSSVEDSKVVVEFAADRRIDDAANDVRDRISRVKDRLPHEMNEPTLTKSRTDDRAIITLALTSDTLDPSAIADYARAEIQKDIESLPGIARVDVIGAGLYKMRLKLDPVKLSAHHITVMDVIHAIRQQNLEKPGGKIISQDREYLVTTVASIETPEEFNLLPIARRENHVVLLQDIGSAEISADDRRSRTRFNGKMGVSLNVIKQSSANPIEIAKSVKAFMEKLQSRLPETMTISMGSDQTRFIEQSVKEVYKTIFDATLLVVLVIFAFLRTARASIIPLVTIPVSLIGVLFFMYLLGFSINTITLMAMVLAIGLVVDDAIVVLENIYRHIERGVPPMRAAVQGIREISFAVIAMTLTLVAVYSPIALQTGLVGKYFTEFAITLAGAVLISGFAALTLSPMMCATMLRPRLSPADNPADTATKTPARGLMRYILFIPRALQYILPPETWLEKVEVSYEHKLQNLLRTPGRLIAAGIGFAIIGAMVYVKLPKELMPNEDRGMIYLDGQAPQSSTLDYTDRYVRQIDDILATIPEITRRVTEVNNPTFDISIQLDDQRQRSTKEVTEDIMQRMRGITGVTVKPAMGRSSNENQANRVEFVVSDNKSVREVRNISDQMTLALYQSQQISVILGDNAQEAQDFTITILRNKAASLGIQTGEIADTIDALIRGRKSTSFKRENRLYDVLVEVMDRARQTPEDITNLFIKANDKEGTLVPLSELVDVTSRSTPPEIFRYNRLRSFASTAVLKEGLGVGAGVDLVTRISQEVLPHGARIEFIGETKRFLEESQSILVVFGLAIIFIYLIMAAQFESWRDPFIIMLSVPLSLAGAILTLLLVGNGSVNIYSQIGFVTLIGLITKHGILMIDFANTLRERHNFDRFQAITQASRARLRPILMTTGAMVLGSLPLAFAKGAGAEARQQIGWVIVGGMSLGTLFTLFVLPAFYLLLAQRKRTRIALEDNTHDSATAPPLLLE